MGVRVFVVGFLLLCACSCNVDRTLLPPDKAAGSDAAVDGCVVGMHCATGSNARSCQCEDCIDDDSDGRVDGDDPECSGYLDDDESTYATGLHKDTRGCTDDCFFDDNSGGAGMDCTVPTACVAANIDDFNTRTGNTCAPLATNPTSTEDCTIAASCTSTCLLLVPSGCDCFGCCNVAGSDGLGYHVLLGIPCSARDLVGGGYGNCIACVPSTSCGNL